MTTGSRVAAAWDRGALPERRPGGVRAEQAGGLQPRVVLAMIRRAGGGGGCRLRRAATRSG